MPLLPPRLALHIAIFFSADCRGLAAEGWVGRPHGLTEQWVQHLAGTGVHVHAMHPGWADTAGVRNWMPVFRALTRPVIRTPEQGADTIVWLGGAPEAVETTGLFWHDRRPRPVTYLIGSGADDDATRRELWDPCRALARRPQAGPA